MKTQFNQIAGKITGYAIVLAAMVSLAPVTTTHAQSKKSTLAKHLVNTESAADPYKPASLQVAVYQVENTTKFKLHFENSASRPVTLTLKNAANKVIHQEVVASPKYIRKFELGNMQDGTYTFEISNSQERITKEIQLQTLAARSIRVNK